MNAGMLWTLALLPAISGASGWVGFDLSLGRRAGAESRARAAVAASIIKTLVEAPVLKEKLARIPEGERRRIVDTLDSFLVQLLRGHYAAFHGAKLAGPWYLGLDLELLPLPPDAEQMMEKCYRVRVRLDLSPVSARTGNAVHTEEPVSQSEVFGRFCGPFNP